MADSDHDQKKLCFVIGPIDDPGSEVRRHADWLLEGIIDPVFTEHFPTFKLERADKIGEPGMITSQVITRLIDAPLVVADMSYHNANAFYELAIRHMVRLPTIHMIGKGFRIPFDVAPHRAIIFARDDYRELEQARRDLRSAIDDALKPTFEVENPITLARGRIALDQHATPEMQVLIETVEMLRSRVVAIETRELGELSDLNMVVRALQANSSASGQPQGLVHPTDMDWTSTGWRRRNPPGATGGSG